MGIIYAAVKPYHITTLKKQLDKAELKHVCRDIDEECLNSNRVPEYQKRYKDKAQEKLYGNWSWGAVTQS